MNQFQDVTVSGPDCEANLTCYKGGERGNLAEECLHTGSIAVTQS